MLVLAFGTLSCFCTLPLQDGSALVHVQGVLAMPNMSGPGVAPMPFTEAFVLAMIKEGEYYVANQVHRKCT